MRWGSRAVGGVQVFNVNVPNSDPSRSVGPVTYAVTTPGIINYIGDTVTQKDVGSNIYYLAGEPAYAGIAGSDCVAVWHGTITGCRRSNCLHLFQSIRVYGSMS